MLIMPKRFDLRSIQSDSLDLPSVASYLNWRPSLREFQQESEEFPSLKNFQSLDEDEFPSLKSIQTIESDEDSPKKNDEENKNSGKKGKSDTMQGTGNMPKEKSLTKRRSLSESSLLETINAINMKKCDDMEIINKGSEKLNHSNSEGKKSKFNDVLDNDDEHAVQNLMVNNFTDIGPQRKLKSKMALRERFQPSK